MSGAGDWIEGYLLEQADAKRTWRKPVRVVATTTQTLSGLPTIDGVALAELDEVLLTANGASNGPWVVSSGAWSRRADFDTSAKALVGALFYVREGTAGAGSWWRLSGPTSTIVLNTTSLTFNADTRPSLAFGSFITIGAAPLASAGLIRVPKGNAIIEARNAANNGNIVVLSTESANDSVNLGMDAVGAYSATYGKVGGSNYAALDGGVTTYLNVNGAIRVTVVDALVTFARNVEVDGQLSSAVSTQAFSATPTFDFNNGNNHSMAAATANITVTLSNPRDGTTYRIRLTQDGTGGRTVTWPAATRFEGTDNVFGATANNVTLWEFFYENSLFRCLSRKVYAS